MDLNNVTDQNGNPLGMGWYKFLIYFALFAGGILNAGTGILSLTGMIYEVQDVSGVTAEMVYRVYGDGLRVLDILSGLALIAAGVFAFIVRDKLAKFKPEAPKFVTILYSFALGASVFYVVLASAITSISLIESQAVTISMSVVFLCVNISYFRKRAFLFNGNVSVYKPNQNQYSTPVTPQVQAYAPYQNQNAAPVAPQAPVQAPYQNQNVAPVVQQAPVQAPYQNQNAAPVAQQTPVYAPNQNVAPVVPVASQNPMQYDEEKTQILMPVPETPVAPIAPVASEPQAEPARKHKFCMECGTALVPGTKFCMNCGTKIE